MAKIKVILFSLRKSQGLCRWPDWSLLKPMSSQTLRKTARLSAITGGLIATLATLALAASPAHAEQVSYAGGHPIPAYPGTPDGGYCYIEVPHVHVYTPAEPEVLYRVHDNTYHFVGDPVAYHYDGPKYNYYGHHPIHVDISVDIHIHNHHTEYCYIDGPHYHDYAPPDDIKFELHGDAYWYIGKFPRKYRRERKQLVRINTVYEPIVYERPVVVVEAPPRGYYGPFIEINVNAPVVEVRPPEVRAGVEVHIPVPTIEVDVAVPGVIVVDKRRRYKRPKKYRKRYRKHRRHRKHRGDDDD